MQDYRDFTPWPTSLATRYRQLGFWQDKTLVDHFRQTASQCGEQVAMIDAKRQLTYQQAIDEIERLAAGFRAHGIGANDNVIVQLPNCVEFYLSFYALLQIGARPIMALPAHRQRELSFFCQHADVKAMVITEEAAGFDYLSLAKQLLDNQPSLEHVFVCQPQQESPVPYMGVHNFGDLYQHGRTDNQDGQADHIAFFQLSGGTTGTPKLIPRTHNDYAYSVQASVDVCQWHTGTRYLCVLPAAHNYPLSSPGALGVFSVGGCVVLSQDASANTAFSLIEQYRITDCALVPSIALLWLEAQKRNQCDLSSLSLIQVGGQKLSANVAAQIPQAFACQLQQVFGMAEGLVNYTRLDDPLETIIHTQGRAMSSADEVRVVDEQGNDVPLGQEGYLITQGPYTIRGYYRAPEHNQRAFTDDGFYRTGDLVKMDAAGNLMVTGRDKDQINRGGEKIAAEEIENYLLAHPAIFDAALVAIADPYLGERSLAVVVLKEGQTLSAIGVKRCVRDMGVADYKIPDKVVFCDALPMTPVGKVDKKALRTQFAPNAHQAATPVE